MPAQQKQSTKPPEGVCFLFFFFKKAETVNDRSQGILISESEPPDRMVYTYVQPYLQVEKSRPLERPTDHLVPNG